MAVTARQSPDFRTISDFRKRHLPALGERFTQVLQLCQKAGLVSLGHVALDGTKIRANASKHKAMSYSRMKTAEPALAAEVAQWLAKAAASDAREDEAYGVDRRGDELPEGWRASSIAWRRSVRPKPHWKPTRRTTQGPRNRRTSTHRIALDEAAPRRILQARPTTTHSAISPIQTAGL